MADNTKNPYKWMNDPARHPYLTGTKNGVCAMCDRPITEHPEIPFPPVNTRDTMVIVVERTSSGGVTNIAIGLSDG